MIIKSIVDEEEFRINLGKNIQRIRSYRGFEAKELADKIDISPQTMSRIETGKQENLGLKSLLKICKELNTSPEELFMKDSDLLSLRFVISEHNVATLKEVVNIIKGLIEKKGE